MNHPAVKVAAIVMAGLFFIMLVFFRYEIHTLGGSPIVYKLNKVTGDVCAQWPSGEVQCQGHEAAKAQAAAAPSTAKPKVNPLDCNSYPVGTIGDAMNKDKPRCE